MDGIDRDGRLRVFAGLQSKRRKCVNAKGTVVVGTSDGGISPYGQAFRWTASTGMFGLGFLPGSSNSNATGVNANGSVVVGYSGINGGVQAFRWTAQTGMQSVADLLIADGINLGGWDPKFAEALSPNGNIIVGFGIDPNENTEAWIADIPISSTPLPATLPLFAAGLGALGLLGWRRTRKAAAIAAA